MHIFELFISSASFRSLAVGRKSSWSLNLVRLSIYVERKARHPAIHGSNNIAQTDGFTHFTNRSTLVRDQPISRTARQPTEQSGSKREQHAGFTINRCDSSLPDSRPKLNHNPAKHRTSRQGRTPKTPIAKPIPKWDSTIDTGLHERGAIDVSGPGRALTLLVAGALVDGVALGALGLEDLLAGRGVPRGRLRKRRHRRRSRANGCRTR